MDDPTEPSSGGAKHMPPGEIDIVHPGSIYVDRAEARYKQLALLAAELAAWRLRAITLAAVEGFVDKAPAAAAESLLQATRLAYNAYDDLVAQYARDLAMQDQVAEVAGLRAGTLAVHELADALVSLREYIDNAPDYSRADAERKLEVVAQRFRAVIPEADEIISGGE